MACTIYSKIVKLFQAYISMINQFHEFLDLIFGWFLPFGPIVQCGLSLSAWLLSGLYCSIVHRVVVRRKHVHFNKILSRNCTYHKVASSNRSCLEAHTALFRLLMKGIFGIRFKSMTGGHEQGANIYPLH